MTIIWEGPIGLVLDAALSVGNYLGVHSKALLRLCKDATFLGSNRSWLHI